MSAVRRMSLLLLLAYGLQFPAMGAPSTAHMGFPGYLETPHAYMLADGSLNLNLSRAYPYSTISLGAQFLPRLYFGARYTSVSGREYGPGVESQSYKDKGFDVVLQAVQEDRYWPAISVGLLDIGGTGLFSSEYVVASKSLGAWTASAGLGWGRMGRAGDLDNPLGALDAHFDAPRQQFDPDSQSGGDFLWENWFSGPDVALFGALAWQSPSRRWQWVLEWDGNSYDQGVLNPEQTDEEASRNRIEQDSRLNLGLRYRVLRNVVLQAGYIRGNTWTLGIQLFEQFGRSKAADNPPLPSMRIPQLVQHAGSTAWSRALAEHQIYPLGLDQSAPEQPTVYAILDRNGTAANNAEAVARLTASAFPQTQSVEVVEMRGGMPIRSMQVPPDLLTAARGNASSESEVQIDSASRRALPSNPDQRLGQYPALSWDISPALRSNIGGAGGFFLSDLQIKPSARWQLNPKISLSGTLALRVYGNLDEVSPGIPSALPPVRSNLEQYQATNGALYLDSLQLEAFEKIGRSSYAKLSAGVLEEMFSGIHLQTLHAPHPSRLAWGVELAQVWQRDFHQWLGLQDYQSTTGHMNVFWNTGWMGLRVHLSAGRYLAGDWGATLDISRRTRSGYAFGVFATKTDVSAEDFGEGSFDKGFYFTLPLPAIDRRADRGRASFDYRFLTRDGGQKLRVGRRLEDMIGAPFEAGL